MIQAFVGGGIVFLVIFGLGVATGAYLTTPRKVEEPEFVSVEGGKRVCKRV